MNEEAIISTQVNKKYEPDFKGYHGANAKIRSQEKLQLLGHWLKKFHHSPASILHRVMRSNPDNRHYLPRLVKKRVLYKINQPLTREKVYMLSAFGVSHLCIDPEAYVSTNPSEIQNQIHFEHAFLCQKVMLDIIDRYRYEDFWVEKKINKKHNLNWSNPDLLVQWELSSGRVTNCAFEVERTTKSRSRVQDTFDSHRLEMGQGSNSPYHHVVYVFDKDLVRDKYLNLFNEDKWIYFNNGEVEHHSPTFEERYPFSFLTISDIESSDWFPNDWASN